MSHTYNFREIGSSGSKTYDSSLKSLCPESAVAPAKIAIPVSGALCPYNLSFPITSLRAETTFFEVNLLLILVAVPISSDNSWTMSEIARFGGTYKVIRQVLPSGDSFSFNDVNSFSNL